MKIASGIGFLHLVPSSVTLEEVPDVGSPIRARSAAVELEIATRTVQHARELVKSGKYSAGFSRRALLRLTKQFEADGFSSQSLQPLRDYLSSLD